MKRIIALFLAVTLFFSGAGEILAAGGSDENSNVNVGTNTEIVLADATDYGLEVESGTCGDTGNEANVTWAIFDSNADGDDKANTGDTLVFSGSGAMASYTDISKRPWASYTGTIKTIIFEENSSITNIGVCAFRGFSSLKSVSISDSVTTIESTAFGYCSSLESIVIPENVRTIGNSAFNSCSSLTSIELPTTLETIGEYAFSFCSSLTSIVIPKNVSIIGDDAFDGCKKLEIEIAEENNYFSFENGIFYNKDKTTLIVAHSVSGDFVVPDTVEEIDEGAFWGCKELTGITIPEGVTVIKEGTFRGCKNLKNVILPNSLTSIEEYAFYATGIEAITIPDGVTAIKDYVFGSCPLKEITLSKNLTEIGDYAFKGCPITEITLPEGLTRIEEGVFESTGLTSLIIPKTVTYLGWYVVRYSGNVKALYCPSYLEAGMYYSELSKGIKGSYTVNDDNTVSIVVEYIPENFDLIELPEEISGCKISSISFKEGLDSTGVVIQCAKHNSEACHWEKDVDGHRYIVTCNICGGIEEDREAHEFPEGTQACECGYVPFYITEQSENKDLVYGQGTELTVVVDPAYEDLEITYQWYENGKAIEGATVSTYTVEAGKAVSDYTYVCKVSCGGYSKESDEIEVRIAKADAPSVLPDTEISVANTIKKVSDVTLPTDWQWDSEDVNKNLPAGKEVEVTANYVGEEKEFYDNISVKVIIKRADCVSSEVLYTGEGEKAPTCISEGKGHKECTLCGELLESNIIVPVLKHTLTKVDKKEASCITIGMEQHWKCSECKKLFADEQGTKEVTESDLIIATNGHTWDNGVITKEPTTTEKGVKTYTCTVCKTTKTEEIDKIADEEPEKPADVAVTKVTLNKSKANLGVGKTLTLKAEVTPKNATNQELTWKSSNTKVVTVDKNGKVKGIKKGTATITVTTANGKKATCKVTVVKATLNATSLPLQVKKSVTLKVTSSLKGDKVKSWKSSNTKVVTVKNGKVTAKSKTGTAKITVTMKSGATATCTVKVQKGTVTTKKLTLNKKTATLKVGKKLTLKVTRNPITATDKITWTTSDKKIATVDKNGKVTAKKAGTVMITAKNSKGKKVTCKVTVKKK